MPRKGELQSPATKAASRANAKLHAERTRKSYEAHEYRSADCAYQADDSYPADIMAAFRESETD